MANKIYVGQEGAQKLYRRVKALSANYATAEQGAKADAAYQKPVDGIPKSDLDSGVQASLGKADTALQEHQDVSGKANKSEMAITAVSGDTSKKTIQLKNGLSQNVVVDHQDIFGKADKVLPAAEGNIASLNASGNLTDSGIPAASGSSPVSLAHTSAGYAWKGWGSGTYEVPWVIPNCLALIEGNKFDENGKLIPNYSRGEISVSSSITESDMTNPSSTFPLNSDYPVFSMNMVNHNIKLVFPPQDIVSLEYYLYYKRNPQLHPRLRNNGKGIYFNTESGYYSSNWEFRYYDSTGTEKAVSCGSYNNNTWVHCLIELDRKAGKLYAYRGGTLVAQGTCENAGNVSIELLSAASYWTYTPEFVHASLWNVRLSGGETSFDPSELYRNWGIYTE